MDSLNAMSLSLWENVHHFIMTSVTTPHFHKCQGEPLKKAKNSQGLGKAIITENLYAKVNNE